MSAGKLIYIQRYVQYLWNNIIISAGFIYTQRGKWLKERLEEIADNSEDFTNSEKRKCSTARTQHSGLMKQTLVHWERFRCREKQILPAGEVEIIFDLLIHQNDILKSQLALASHFGTVPPSPVHQVEPCSWRPDSHREVSAAWGSSDGRLKHGNISSWNEVFILSINQRVPLVKVRLQTCKIQTRFMITRYTEYKESQRNDWQGWWKLLTEVTLQKG